MHGSSLAVTSSLKVGLFDSGVHANKEKEKKEISQRKQSQINFDAEGKF